MNDDEGVMIIIQAAALIFLVLVIVGMLSDGCDSDCDYYAFRDCQTRRRACVSNCSRIFATTAALRTICRGDCSNDYRECESRARC